MWKKISKAISAVGLVSATAALQSAQDPAGPVAAIIPPKYVPLYMMSIVLINSFLPPVVERAAKPPAAAGIAAPEAEKEK